MNKLNYFFYCSSIALFLLIPVFQPDSVQAQNINTIVGNGSPAFAGNGGPATSASIDYPTHTAMDGSGNLYFGDYANNCIRKVDLSGVITNFCGNGMPGYSGDGGLATAASMNATSGLAFDRFGNLFFADYVNNAIRKVSTSGIISTVAGTGIAGFSGDGGPATFAQVNAPWGVAVDTSGNVYFADRNNNRIRKINTSGIISTFVGNGSTGFSGDGGLATAAGMDQPVDIVLDRFGNMYVSDFFNNRIRKVNSTGIISSVAGNGTAGYSGDGMPATNSELNNPVGVGVDSIGNIYIGDYLNNRVRKVNTSGIISTIAGNGSAGYGGDGGPATAAVLNTPYGVSVYNSGNIYICDAFNYRIRMIGHNNFTPVFTEGSIQNINICEDESPTSLDTILTVFDADSGQTETWSLITPPAHGTALVAFTMTSNSDTLHPAGLTFAPAPGYTGTDMFKVKITDGISSSVVTVNVIIGLAPNPGTISGSDSVCPGNSVTLSETSTGGIWSSGNMTIADINSSGLATGITPGVDTIIYTIINTCGIASSIFQLNVNTYTECNTGIQASFRLNSEDVVIYPNPNNGNFNLTVGSNSNDHAHVVIYNVLGENLKDVTISSNKPISFSLDLLPGIYYLDITTASNKYVKEITITR